MSNESDLQSLLTWWRAIPEFRRPGHDGRFSMISHDVETYILGLRENWASCGKSVLAICEPLREKLEREARATIQDLLAWLELVRAKLLVTPAADGASAKELQTWIDGWRESLNKLADGPLQQAPGISFGVGFGAQMLDDYRWCGDLAGEPRGVGGPLMDAPASILPAVAKDSSIELSAAQHAVLDAFPVSVTELQFSVARSPWTATYILNWLLSDKGVLPQSRKSPRFDGPPSVPYARAWLDQLAPVFRDWHVSKFVGRREEGLRLDRGHLKQVYNLRSNPALSAALSQIDNPVIPSAYVVPFGSPPIPTAKDKAAPLETAAGQCMVFEFLLSRLQILAAPETTLPSDPTKPPLLVVLDGPRRNTLALQVGAATQASKLPRGAAMLLHALGEKGEVDKVSAQSVAALRAVPQIEPFVKVGKKVGNYYTSCSSLELKGQVRWRASIKPAT